MKVNAVGRGKVHLAVIDNESGKQPDEQEIGWAGAVLHPPGRGVFVPPCHTEKEA